MLQQEKGKLEHNITQGMVNDFANYRFTVGQIKGLQKAIDIYKNIFKGEIND